VGHGPDTQYRTTGLTPDGLPVGPSRTFLLGTDNLGRDILVRIAYGARISLLVGVVSTLLAVVSGVVVGLVAGYSGGAVDTVLARFMDVVLSFPFLLFAIALVAVVGPSLRVAILVIAFFSWAAVGRVIRGQTLSLREREFFEATLSFLGLGVVPPTPSWGGMLADSLQYYQVAWWFVLFPGLALLATTLSFNLLGDSVRDALDPNADRLQRRP
jgi:peptide/nickel transport system permease protein